MQNASALCGKCSCKKDFFLMIRMIDLKCKTQSGIYVCQVLQAGNFSTKLWLHNARHKMLIFKCLVQNSECNMLSICMENKCKIHKEKKRIKAKCSMKKFNQTIIQVSFVAKSRRWPVGPWNKHSLCASHARWVMCRMNKHTT